MSGAKYVQVVHLQTGEVLIESARWCQSRLCRLRGLQFRPRPDEVEGLILVHDRDSIAISSIHMLFVFFPIAAIWINTAGHVTHKVLAKPWRPFYASPEPARYVLEASPAILDRISVGDQVDFIE